MPPPGMVILTNQAGPLFRGHPPPPADKYTGTFNQFLPLSDRWMCYSIFTDRVRSTTGRLCFDTCLSINLSVHTWGEVPEPGPGGGGYPSQVQVGGTPPRVPPHQTWMGGTPPQVPSPKSDLDGGTPTGGVPHFG